MRKYTLDETFFQKINTEEKAYFLGLMYADGSVIPSYQAYYIKISLQNRDKQILEDFRKALSSNYPFRHYQDNMTDFSVFSKQLGSDLIKKGCMVKKTKILTFPNISIMPENLLKDFIRGYFDGDGCVWEGKRKKMIVKDSTREIGMRERIVHNVKVNFTGNIQFIEELNKYLNSKNIVNSVKINIRKNKENSAMVEYSGRRQMKRIYDYFYENSNIYLRRKKEKFESILKLC